MQYTNDSGRQFWSSFRALRKVASNTPEGKGGVSAISGFAFQFLVSLEAMVATANEAEKVRVFLESLSDLTVSQGDRIEVTQVKLTLSSSATGKGIEELWKVHLLALDHTPDLVPSLRYRLLGNKTALKYGRRSIEHRLKTWEPSGTFDQEQLDAFRGSLSVEITANPRLNLATRLVNLFAIDDPLVRIEKWIGKLLCVESHAQLTAQAEAIAVELDALAAHRREVEATFRLWSASDCPPEAVRRETDQKKWVLTGQVPNRDHLREGRFAPRRVYSEIAEKAEKWLGSGRNPSRERIAAFWIAGRSGSGKSVALLHLLSALHAADSGRVIVWLGDKANRIGEAVRWCRPFLSEGHQVIIAADDPFTSAKQIDVGNSLGLAKAEIETLQELDADAPQPVLILCGPTEQAEAFRYELTDYVETLTYPFPHETREDIEELRAWYLRRTGRTDLPLEATHDVLIVQLFFEWTTGEVLESFARRLEQRLRDFAQDVKPGLFETVAKILALNRLYALYPAAAIEAELKESPEVEAGFRQLADAEGHFSLDTGAGGYRLTHPHLADAIYRTWFGKPRDAGFRKRHLRQAIGAALEFGNSPSQRFAPLWAISRLASPQARDNPDVAQRITLIHQDLEQVLPEIFSTHFSVYAEPLVTFPVWATLDAAFQLNLAPSPINVLIASANGASIDAPGLRLTCHILIGIAAEQTAARDTVRQILLNHADWREWPKVMMSYVKRHGLVDLQPQLEAFASGNPSRARMLVFSILSEAVPGHDSSGRTIVKNWFQADDVYLGFQAGALSTAIERWGCALWIREIAIKLLTGFPRHPSWSHLWEVLPTETPEDASEVEVLGREWLADRDPGKYNWDRVWQALWASAPGEKDLHQTALDWLKDQPEHPSWSYVWQDVWGATPDDEVRQTALNWLKDQPEHDSWRFTWEKLWEAAPGNDEVRQIALNWLKDQPEHDSWSFTWKKLWEAAPGSDEVRQTALNWLKDQPEHDFWVFIWHKLWQAAPGDTVLQKIASDWLETAPRYSSLVRRSLAGLPSTALSWDWSDQWKKAWHTAAGDIPMCQRLFTEALTTLSETLPELGGWTSVWRILWDNVGQDSVTHDRLCELAIGWLDLADPGHPRWAPLWCTLWSELSETELPGSETMVALSSRAIGWLSGSSQRPHWPSVWLALWHSCAQLREHLGLIVRSGARSTDFGNEPDAEVATCLRS